MNIAVIETTHNGIRYRSRTEARWAVFFETIGLRFEYERDGHALRSGNYLPDFWLPTMQSGRGMWMEIKGVEPTFNEINLCYELAAATERDVMLAVGIPERRDQIYVMQWLKEGFDEIQFTFSDDRRDDGHYWLASEDGCALWIGSNDGSPPGNNDRHPGRIGGLTDCGFEAARAARFWDPLTRG